MDREKQQAIPIVGGRSLASISEHRSSFESLKASNVKTCNQQTSQCEPVISNTSTSASRWMLPPNTETAKPRIWRKTWRRVGPLSGLFGIVFAIASLIASLGILAGSDQQPVPTWKSPPSTYLAVFTAVTNLSIRYAAIQGVVIAWWVRAAEGSTLAKLHWDWRAGTTLRGALTAGRHMGLLGIACIFSIIVVIDGPLLQRSTTVISAPIADHPVTLNITIAPELPRDFSGFWSPNYPGHWAVAFNRSIPTTHGPGSNQIIAYPNENLGSDVTNAWYNDAPLRRIVHGCPGSCKLKMKAPALFASACTAHAIPMNVHQSWDWNQYYKGAQAPPLDSVGFLIATSLVVSGEHESIDLITGFSKPRDCTGSFDYKICTLKSGIGEYDVSIDENGHTTLESPSRPKFVAFANNSAVNNTLQAGVGLYPSTLGGVAYSAWQIWNSVLAYYPDQQTGQVESMFNSKRPWGLFVKDPTPTKRCQSYSDPTEMVLTSLNKLMVYLGAYAVNPSSSNHQWYEQQGPKATNSSEYKPDRLHVDPGLSMNATTTGYLQGHQNVFESHYWFFVGAVVVDIMCIAFILPTYWGWWRLGRPVSFSPLETAKAFEAPMLANYNSNSSGRDLANAAKSTFVQYGASSNGPGVEKTKLAFADHAIVVPPRNNIRFDV